jgi:hypothetical protein
MASAHAIDASQIATGIGGLEQGGFPFVASAYPFQSRHVGVRL